MLRAALLAASALIVVGCFDAHSAGPDGTTPIVPPECVASAPVIVAPAEPGCASIERLTVQDLPGAPLARCALGAWEEERPVQPVYVGSAGDGPVVVEVEHLSEDCFTGDLDRCGGASASSPDGCACAGDSWGPAELLDRAPPTKTFALGPTGGTIFVGGDRVSYRITACHVTSASDPFPIGCDPEGEGEVDLGDCGGVRGYRAEGMDASGVSIPICYCAPECTTDADCPRTGPGEVAPFCDENGVCRLPCDEGGECPVGTACVRIPRLEARFARPVCATVGSEG